MPAKKASYAPTTTKSKATLLSNLFKVEYAGPNDAAVLKPLDDSLKCLTISCGMNPNYGKIDAYWMAASAIDEAIRNNIAVGGRRISLLDNFTWGNPEKTERLGSLVRACEACYDFAVAFKAPFISGKDSLYNESPLGTVTPNASNHRNRRNSKHPIYHIHGPQSSRQPPLHHRRNLQRTRRLRILQT